MAVCVNPVNICECDVDRNRAIVYAKLVGIHGAYASWKMMSHPESKSHNFPGRTTDTVMAACSKTIARCRCHHIPLYIFRK